MGWFVVFLYFLPLIILVAVATGVKKSRDHKKASEENMQELLRNINSGTDKKEEK